MKKVGENSLRKVFVKIVDESTNEEIEGAQILLFEDGDNIFFLNSDDKGEAQFLGLSANNSYSVSVFHNDYVFKTVPDVPAIDLYSDEATVIELTKATPTNSAAVIVTVKTLEGNLIDGAQVQLIDAASDIAIRFDSTNSEGQVTFSNMARADYKAKAMSFGFEGESNIGSLIDSDLLLEVVLVVQEGSLEVEVVDKDGLPIPVAEVNFIDSITDDVLETLFTDLEGQSGKVSFPWNVKPYVVISADGFVTHQTVAFDLIPSDTIKIKVILITGKEIKTLKCDAENELWND